MGEIKCPNCGAQFTVDELDYNKIASQIKDQVFEKELSSQKELIEKKCNSDTKLAISEAVSNKEKEIAELKQRILNLEGENKLLEKENDLKIANLNEKHNFEIKQKEEEISFYKDLKNQMSTKLLGETLEQHCEIEFNKLRMSAYPNAYFEKDNTVSKESGSKGDFIFKDYIDGIEYISIMFEMKNEGDTTSTKKKNEDFFKELDKDRKEKGCEYAVLVSLLEKDNDLYNSGIVDVSYKYPKMYVVRPQCFMSIISLLSNAAKNSLEYKRQLIEIKNENIDITKFEETLNDYKENFERNVNLAKDRFQKSIEEIDKTIDHLQKVKEALIGSGNNLRIANDKVQEITIKKLTKDNETMKEKFDKLNQK